MSTFDIHKELEALGIDKERLTKAMDSKEPWGSFVHAFEFVTTISVVLDTWPPRSHLKNTGKFPMHEGGR